MSSIPGSLPVRVRPKLELGPMTGDAEYIRNRSQSLVNTFVSLLERDLRLEDNEFGCTDCKTFIKAPLSNEEGYLVVEHEVSHNLFGTDLALTEAFKEKVVERLLRRAGIVSTSVDAIPYTQKLGAMVHHLWSVLEDHRCCWLWSQLAPGGGALLSQRWHDISEYEMEEHAKKDLLTYLARLAAGVATPDAPPEFQRCGPYMIAARNLVEGVDAAACLAITARLIDDITDELLENYPEDKKEEALQKIQAIAASIAPPGQGGKGHGDVEDNPLGGKDVQHPPGRPPKATAKQMKSVQKILTARDDNADDDANGESTFAALLNEGAEEMEERLEEARVEMSRVKKSSGEQHSETLLGACRVAKVKGIFVTPSRKLPAPSSTAAKLRTHLEKVRMQRRKKLTEEGDDLDVEALIQARLNCEMDSAKLFFSEKKSCGMELLLLLDVSGSMTGYGLDLLERAVADVICACSSLEVKVEMWGFSDTVFFFRKNGSPKDVAGLWHGMTNMVQALDVAYEWAKALPSKRTIILITDGAPTSIRGRNSSGNTITDLHNVLEEMRKNRVVLSILAIGPVEARQMYDTAFGIGKYGLLPDITALPKALPETAKVLVEAHLREGSR